MTTEEVDQKRRREELVNQLAKAIAAMEIQPPLSDWKMELEEEPGVETLTLVLSCRVSGISGPANVDDIPDRLERRIKGLDASMTTPEGQRGLKNLIEGRGRSMRHELAVLRGHVDIAGKPIDRELELTNDPDDPEVAKTRPRR